MPISTTCCRRSACLRSIAMDTRRSFRSRPPRPTRSPARTSFPRPRAPRVLVDEGRQGLADDSRQAALACERQLRCDFLGRLHAPEPVGHPEHDHGRVHGQQLDLIPRQRHRRDTAPRCLRRTSWAISTTPASPRRRRNSTPLAGPPPGRSKRERPVRADGCRHLEFGDELLPRQWRGLPWHAGAGRQRRGQRAGQRAQFAPGRLSQYVHIAPGAIGGQPAVPQPDAAHLLELRQHADRQQGHHLLQRSELRQERRHGRFRSRWTGGSRRTWN